MNGVGAALERHATLCGIALTGRLGGWSHAEATGTGL
jgi:hypothetical protein